MARVKNCTHGEGLRVMPFANLYDSEFGDGVFIGPFVEVGGAKIGKNTRISSHSYIPPGVVIGEECFIAHGVMFTNDVYSDVPQYNTLEELGKKWNLRKTVVGNHVRIGSNCTILPVHIGDGAIIGAGSVVTKDVPAGETWIGTAAHLIHPKVEVSTSSGPQEKVYKMEGYPEIVTKSNGDIFLGAVKINEGQLRTIIKESPAIRTATFHRDETPNPC